MKEVCDILKENGYTEEDIEKKKYYDLGWFLERVQPPLPWTRSDKPIFAKRMAEHRCSDAMAEKQLCETVLDYVDGVNVHPKLEYHNRIYLKHRAKIEKIRAATDGIKTDEQARKAVTQ